MPNTLSRLGLHLEARRQERGHDLKAVARETGLNYQTLLKSRYLAEHLSAKTAQSIGAYLGQTAETVLLNSQEPGTGTGTRIVPVETFPYITACGTMYQSPVTPRHKTLGCPCEHGECCQQAVLNGGFALCERAIEIDILPPVIVQQLVQLHGRA